MNELEKIKKELSDKEALFLEAEAIIKSCYEMEHRISEKRWALQTAKDKIGKKIGALRRKILDIVTAH